MDEERRKLERAAQLGDEGAIERLRWLKARLEPEPKPKIDPWLREYETEISVDITVGEDEHYLDSMPVTCYYEIDGRDEPATWDYPGDSANWLLYHVILADQERIDEYNRDCLEEGYPLLLLTEGDDIYPYLTKKQQEDIERDIEEYDRSPDW